VPDILNTPIATTSSPAGLVAGSAGYQNPAVGLTGTEVPQPQLLSNLASIQHASAPIVVSHYNVQPVFDIYANVENRDLGSVADQVQKIVNDVPQHLPRGTTLVTRGQLQSMFSSYVGLGIGVAFAILLVYFLMVVNFQSWLDPFIIITALPGAPTGIVWMLFLTRTTISVPALMCAIMCIGGATSNSILMVTFANEQLRSLSLPNPAMYLPDNTILIDSKGTRVATVDASNKIHFKEITLGRDFGAKSEILAGVNAQDEVVQNPTDDLREGMTVSVQ
jgi:hypothetical protein